MSTLTTDSRIDKSAPDVSLSPSLRIFGALLAFQMRPGAKSDLDMPLSVLVSYLEGLAKHDGLVSAQQLAEAVEFAMKTVAR